MNRRTKGKRNLHRSAQSVKSAVYHNNQFNAKTNIMQYYNVHSHTFTMHNAPSNFLSLFMSDGMASVVDSITDTKAGANTIEFLMRGIGGNLGKRYASFLAVGKSKTQRDVFEEMRRQYDDPRTKFIVLTLYMEECGAGVSESGYEGQLEQLITAKAMYPDNLLIFLGIDPRWKGGGTALRKWVQNYFEKKIQITATRSVYPFVGLKLYPSLGFYAFDERLKETFEWAADNGVPVLTHCNYMGGLYNNVSSYLKANLDPIDPYTGQRYSQRVGKVPQYVQVSANGWQKMMGTIDSKSNQRTCSYFLEPESYRTMIEYFEKKNKPLKICLAHFGGGNQITTSMGVRHVGDIEEQQPYGVLGTNWYQQVLNLMQQHPSVYTDVSYAIYDTTIYPEVFKALNNATYGDRVMFGTDFFLTEREQAEKDTLNKFRTEAMKLTQRIERLNNANAWDVIAGTNTHNYLMKDNKYYPGWVL